MNDQVICGTVFLSLNKSVVNSLVDMHETRELKKIANHGWILCAYYDDDFRTRVTEWCTGGGGVTQFLSVIFLSVLAI